MAKLVEKRVTNGCKTICQSAAKSETVIMTEAKVQNWHNHPIKNVALAL